MNSIDKSDLMNQLEESILGIDHDILMDEIKVGTGLRDEALVLFDKMFDVKEDREKNKRDHAELIQKFTNFEDNIIHFHVLNFLYAIIARCYLNNLQIDVAIQYAHAGIEANKKQNDLEGVSTNRRILLDAACLIHANKEALKLITAYPEFHDNILEHFLRKTPSHQDVLFKKYLESKKRPKSLAFCLDEELANDEKAIRTLMLTMGISRRDALGYKAMASKFPDYN